MRRIIAFPTGKFVGLPYAAIGINPEHRQSAGQHDFPHNRSPFWRTVRTLKWAIIVFLSIGPCCYAGTYTATSCSQSDVNAVINGPAHTAVDGDVIQIPPGSCTWTSGITVPSNIGITIIGSGTPNSGGSTTGANSTCTATVITDQLSGGALFTMTPEYGNSTSRISCMNLLPTTPNPGFGSPIVVTGACTSSGCPSVRLDNLTVPEGWAANGVSDDAFSIVNNMFGVVDHNTVGGPTLADNGVDFVNVGDGAWQGVGLWGDNSWATPDTFGTNQALYLENNTFTNSFGTDADSYPGNGDFGGGRYVCRFNTFNSVTPATACTDHGTDTIGRVRGGRQIEFYGNTVNCPTTCGAIFGDRSSVSLVFDNTIASGATGAFVSVDTQRTWRADSPWGPCDGSGAFDQNDGTTYYSGTVGSVSMSGDEYSVADSGSLGLSANQLVPNSGDPYSFHDVTQDFGFEIGSNTSSAFTSFFSCYENGCSAAPAAGDSFQILRASACMDQPGRGQGQLVEGGDCNTYPTSGYLCPVLASTGKSGPVAEALDPSYEFDDSGTVTGAQYVSNDSEELIANRDFYAQNIGQTAQTSPSAPFNGTSGTGWGTLANRPATCKQGVGYWATDQGTWNQSGSGGQGELFVCTATNTWSLYYQPYTYPHPLESGTVAATPPPPSNLTGSYVSD